MLKETKRKIFYVTLFGVAMGYFEASVVVYLRQIYMSGESLFPMQIILDQTGIVEIGREFFSLVMILAVAGIAGRRSLKEKVAYFFQIFAVWDILYYVFLKITIDWPDSLMTWDILFLIPCAWVSPVLAPVIVSVTFLVISILIIDMEDKNIPFKRGVECFILEVMAGIIIILSFCWDFRNIHAGGLPNPFAWEIFLCGEIMVIVVFAMFYRKSIYPRSP